MVSLTFKFNEEKVADAVAVFGMIIPRITKNNIEFVDYLDEWIYNINGRPEDCIECARYWEGRRELIMARGY